jgi:hypothetical protein
MTLDGVALSPGITAISRGGDLVLAPGAVAVAVTLCAVSVV